MLKHYFVTVNGVVVESTSSLVRAMVVMGDLIGGVVDLEVWGDE